MNDGAWERLTDAIDIKLGILRHGRDFRTLEDRPDLSQKVEFIEFARGEDKYRLERATGPAIIDRKSHYSGRPGTANRIENVYDSSEEAHQVKLLKQIESKWEEVDINEVGL